MVRFGYYYDERDNTYVFITYEEMYWLYWNDNEEYRYRKERLFLDPNGEIAMVIVIKGLHKGFRRKGNNGLAVSSAHSHSGRPESRTHLVNKAVLKELKHLKIKYHNEEVDLFIKNATSEYPITCHGRHYIADIFFELERTEPEHYYSDWNGELFFELFYTHIVTGKKAHDFACDRHALFEYKIPRCFNVYQNITTSGLEKRMSWLKNRYEQKGVYGILVCDPSDDMRF